MACSLSNLVDSLAEGIHTIKSKDSFFFLEYERVKDNLIKYECPSCNNDYLNKILMKNLKSDSLVCRRSENPHYYRQPPFMTISPSYLFFQTPTFYILTISPIIWQSYL